MDQRRVSGVVAESKHRKSLLIAETLEHVGTKQEVFMETHLCLINRFPLTAGELFTETKAHEYMKKNYRKRQSHCTARVMEDRISLERCKNSGSKPFRVWLYYSEINEIYTSPVKKQFFTLCVQSVSTQNKYYEIYKCKTIEETEKFIKFIKQANSDPNNVLRSVNTVRTTAVTNDLVRQSIGDFAIYDVENSDDESDLDHQFELKTEKHHNTYQRKSKNFNNSYPVEIERPRSRNTRSSYKSSPLSNSFSQSLGDLKDVTYILIDSKHAPHIAENGPIYMFCTRRQTVVNQSNGYSESSNNYDQATSRSRSNYR